MYRRKATLGQAVTMLRTLIFRSSSSYVNSLLVSRIAPIAPLNPLQIVKCTRLTFITKLPGIPVIPCNTQCYRSQLFLSSLQSCSFQHRVFALRRRLYASDFFGKSPPVCCTVVYIRIRMPHNSGQAHAARHCICIDVACAHVNTRELCSQYYTHNALHADFAHDVRHLLRHLLNIILSVNAYACHPAGAFLRLREI